MSESKYAKLIVTQPMKEEHGYEVKDGPDVISSMAYLDGGVIPGAFYVRDALVPQAHQVLAQGAHARLRRDPGLLRRRPRRSR